MGHQGNAPQGVLSQWYPAEFTVRDITYKTAEHWMMAEKARIFDDKESFDKIIQVNHPNDAKKLGRKVKNFDLVVWNELCFNVVACGNCYKFAQNPDMFEYLRKTRDKILVEASPYDKIWGIGMGVDHKDINDPSKWQGLNLLGFALMQARKTLIGE